MYILHDYEQSIDVRVKKRQELNVVFSLYLFLFRRGVRGTEGVLLSNGSRPSVSGKLELSLNTTPIGLQAHQHHKSAPIPSRKTELFPIQFNR